MLRISVNPLGKTATVSIMGDRTELLALAKAVIDTLADPDHIGEVAAVLMNGRAVTVCIGERIGERGEP